MLYDDLYIREPARLRTGAIAVAAVLLLAGLGTMAFELFTATPPRHVVNQVWLAHILPDQRQLPPPPKAATRPSKYPDTTTPLPALAIPRPRVAPAVTDLAGPNASRDYGIGVGEAGGGPACVDPAKCGGKAPEPQPADIDTVLYEGTVRNLVRSALDRDQRLRSAVFRTVAELVFNDRGGVASVTLRDFEGDPDVRKTVEQVLRRMSASNALPPALEQGRPWVISISARAQR